MDDPLDPERIAKAWIRWRAPGNRLGKTRNLDHREVIEADLVPRGGTEPAIGRTLRPGGRRRSRRAVRSFAPAKKDCARGAGDFEGEVHRPSGRSPIGLDGTVLGTQDRLGAIVDQNRPPAFRSRSYRSKTVTLTDRQRSDAGSVALNLSLRMGFSPQSSFVIIKRRRSFSKSRASSIIP